MPTMTDNADEETDLEPAETSDDKAAGPTADARLLIHNQYLKDLSFENPGGPARLTDLQSGPDIKVNIAVRTEELGEGRHEVDLSIDVTAKVEDRTAFLVELHFAGVVSLGEQVAPHHIEPLLKVEAPRYLFPFARNILADVTRQGGFPPLLINPIDFAQLYVKERAAQGAV